MVRAGKYRGDEAILRALGHACADALPMRLVDDPDIDVVVAVPSSPWRRMIRGMNPADLVAAPIAARLGVPLGRPLARAWGTSQARVTRRERGSNIRGAYHAISRVEGRVLLVDDVLTTGATARACADELLCAGAQGVCLLTVAATSRRVPDS
jgi:predicted amidophosphoribosyltransferase